MSFDKDLPTAKRLENGDSVAFKRLLLAVKELQADAAPLSGLINAGIARTTTKGVIYDPKTTNEAAFDSTDNTVPDAPTGLTADATQNLVFLEWTIPDFQPLLSSSEVWIINAPLFRDDTAYVIGDFVTYLTVVYIFTSNHSAGVWNAGDVSAAGAGDLIVTNAKERYQTPVNSAVIAVDVGGGTVYVWVRLISFNNVAGEFSASAAVAATAKTTAHRHPLEIAARIALRI